MSRPLLLPWALAANAVAYALDEFPLPRGTSEAIVGRWRIVVNTSSLEVIHSAPGKPDVELPAFEIYVENLDYLIFGLLGPFAGVIGGIPEDEFIAQIVAAMPAQALEPFREELERRKESLS